MSSQPIKNTDQILASYLVCNLKAVCRQTQQGRKERTNSHLDLHQHCALWNWTFLQGQKAVLWYTWFIHNLWERPVKHQHTDLKDTGNSTFLMFHHRTNSWVCHRNEMRWMVAKNWSKDTIREQLGLCEGRSQHLSLVMVVTNDKVYRFLKVQTFSKATRQPLPINFSKDWNIQYI